MDERKPLEFLKDEQGQPMTLTVEQFKHQMHVDEIKVKRSSTTGKLFIQYGAKTGSCSTKGVPERPMLSYVQGEPTEQNPSGKFWLLHEEGNGGEVVATF
jgi:hypothetical protein